MKPSWNAIQKISKLSTVIFKRFLYAKQHKIKKLKLSIHMLDARIQSKAQDEVNKFYGASYNESFKI